MDVLDNVADGIHQVTHNNISAAMDHFLLRVESNLIIQFDLDFMWNGLQRITAYMDHPSASFFRPNSFVQRSVCQEATLNFFQIMADSRIRKLYHHQIFKDGYCTEGKREYYV